MRESRNSRHRIVANRACATRERCQAATQCDSAQAALSLSHKRHRASLVSAAQNENSWWGLCACVVRIHRADFSRLVVPSWFADPADILEDGMTGLKRLKTILVL